MISLVSLELDRLKQENKLAYLAVVGSSIPLLPLPILEYLAEWVKRYFDEVLVYFDYVTMPEHYTIPGVPIPSMVPRRTLIIYGSKAIAVNMSFSSLNLNNSQVKILLKGYNGPVEGLIRRVCEKAGYEYPGHGYVCTSKNGRRAILFKPVFNGNGDIEALVGAVYYVPKDYIKLGDRYVSWLGGRLTRGVQLPRKIKYLVVATSSKSIVIEDGPAGPERKEKFRPFDMLQVLFRINSRPDIIVGLTPQAEKMMEYTITWFNRHVRKLVELVNDKEK